MADTLQTKKVTDLTENTAMSDEDLFMVGSAGTASLRKLKWSNIWNTIKTAILGKLVANNLTTTAAGYLLDARQGKALDDKISELNTHKKMIYVHNGVVRNTGDASLAALLTRLINEGYYNGAISTASYPEFPTQAWTYIVRWNFSFDTLAFVEMYRLYAGDHLWNWLRITDSTWTSSTWFTT